MNHFIKTVALIGSGNVASHIGKVLIKNNITITQVFSRTSENAKALARQLNSEGINDLSQLNTNIDLVLISVKDDVLVDVANKIPENKAIVAHTTGSISINVLKRFKFHGVFYPLQTFSKKKEIDFSTIPICIEAKDESTSARLERLGEIISNNVRHISSEQRKVLHVAAVFACNFSNHFYAIAEDILGENQMDFNILLPLIQETTNKLKHGSPLDFQTGPAVRNDQIVVNEHLKFLENNENYQKIYEYLSRSILNLKNEKEL